MVCFWCDQISHSNDCCGKPVECYSEEGEHPLCPENLTETHPSPMEDGVEREAELGGEETRVQVVWPRLDPWMVMSKVRPPRASPIPVKRKRATMVQMASMVPNSKHHDLPVKPASLPNSPPNCEGWWKLVKVARQQSPDQTRRCRELADSVVEVVPIGGKSAFLY